MDIIAELRDMKRKTIIFQNANFISRMRLATRLRTRFVITMKLILSRESEYVDFCFYNTLTMPGFIALTPYTFESFDWQTGSLKMSSGWALLA